MIPRTGNGSQWAISFSRHSYPAAKSFADTALSVRISSWALTGRRTIASSRDTIFLVPSSAPTVTSSFYPFAIPPGSRFSLSAPQHTCLRESGTSPFCTLPLWLSELCAIADQQSFAFSSSIRARLGTRGRLSTWSWCLFYRSATPSGDVWTL